MNLTTIISLFVPVVDGKFERKLFWTRPYRYIVTNGLAIMFWFIMMQAFPYGLMHGFCIGMTLAHTPFISSGCWVVILKQFGFNPYSPLR